MRHLRLVFVLLVLSPLAARAEGEAHERWDRLYIAGGHAGHVHTVVERAVEDGEARVLTHMVTQVAMKRMGTVTRILSTSRSWETTDGELLRIETETEQSAQTTKSVYIFREGTLTLKTTLMGKERVTTKPVGTDLKGPAFASRALAALAGTSGEEARVKSYVADFQKVVTTVYTSKGPETTNRHDGTPAEWTRVEGRMEGLPIRTTSWLDAAGDIAKTSMKLAGLEMESYRVESRAAAVAPDKAPDKAPEGNPDVFVQTLITEPDPIPTPRHLLAARIRVKVFDETVPLPAIQGTGVQGMKQADGSLLVQAKRVVPPEGGGGVRPLVPVPSALADALAPSSVVQSDAEAIVRVANEVVGEETDAWAAAQTLERWVYEHMTEKGMGVAFGSALEAYETKEGDCTEHAVLLAALCRAAGIPARVVMGLEYLYGIWGGHAWNDVWIDGTWYPLDATNAYGFVDPLHLPLAYMSMKEGGAGEFLEVIGALGNLDVDILSVARGRGWIEVENARERVRLEGRRYENPIWRIRFDAPEGCQLEAPETRRGMRSSLVEVEGTATDGEPVEIEVHATDASPKGTWAGILEAMRVDPASAKPTEVDGRPARVLTRTSGGRHTIITVVTVDDALFLFRIDNAGGEAQRRAYEALLAGVDFDLEAAGGAGKPK